MKTHESKLTRTNELLLTELLFQELDVLQSSAVVSRPVFMGAVADARVFSGCLTVILLTAAT